MGRFAPRRPLQAEDLQGAKLMKVNVKTLIQTGTENDPGQRSEEIAVPLLLNFY